MSVPRLTFTVIAMLLLLAPSASQSLAQPAGQPVAAALPASSGSMLIVENAGQWPENARFQVWNSPLGPGTTWLAEDAIWLVVAGGRSQVAGGKWQVAGSEGFAGPWADLQPANLPPATLHALKLTFPGSNPNVRIEPFGAVDTTVSYLLGNDPAQWRPDVPVWGGVRYVDLYPGVDLVLGGHSDAWRLEAAPGAVIEQVRMQVEGAPLVALDGAVMALEAGGEPLSVALPSAPFAYHVVGLSGGGEPISLPARAPQRPNPAALAEDSPGDLCYSTFLGGGRRDSGRGIALDGTGSAYITGSTRSTDFPSTPGALDPTYNSGSFDAFVVKLNPSGSALVYATFLGGGSGMFADDFGRGIAVDETGSAYVTGHTSSADFPVTPEGFNPIFGAGLCGMGEYLCSDAYVVKLDPSGSALVYGTYLGGSGDDSADAGYAIAVDETGSAYVTGITTSTGFPTTPGSFDPTFNGGACALGPCYDAFIAKFNPAGSILDYGTFLGASGDDIGSGIAVDRAGSTYVTGYTTSSDFPTTPNAFSTSYNGGYSDAFVVKLDPFGSALDYATFLGGTSNDSGSGIALDGTGSAYITGGSRSADFPATPNAFDPSYNGNGDVVVVKLNQTGSALEYATFLGGSSGDVGIGIAVDAAGSAYVTGGASSSEFPTSPGSFDLSYNGYSDAFLIRLNAAGSELTYGSFLGGSGSHPDPDSFTLEAGWAIAVDGMGNAYVTGETYSSDFPTTPSAFDPTYNGGGYEPEDAFVTKMNMNSDQPCCDFDGDGMVGVADIVIIAGLWGQEAREPYDQNSDGWITIVDIQRVARWWGWSVP